MKIENTLGKIEDKLKGTLKKTEALVCLDENNKKAIIDDLKLLIDYSEAQIHLVLRTFTSPNYAPRHLTGLELLEHLVLLSKEKSEAEFAAGAAKHLAEEVKKLLAAELRREKIFRLFDNDLGYSVILNDGEISLFHEIDGTQQKIDI